MDHSCIIKLQSPFHSTTTAQTALKGNCITFLQNVPNIVNSLPLTLTDLCDTLKVIFIGPRPPDRLHLRKVLTVRKKKIIEALGTKKCWIAMLSQIMGVTKVTAEQIMIHHPDPYNWTIDNLANQEKSKNRKIGTVVASRIIRIFKP